MAFPTGWTRQCKITCNHTLVPGTLSGFPALLGYNIVGSENNIPTEMLVTSGANAAKSDGSDIRFSSDAAGASPLHCEVVNWTQHATIDASRKAEIWVNFGPSSSVDTDIYVWYGNAAASAPAANDAIFGSQGVWDSNFRLVWHLPNGSSSLSIADSTSNARTGVATNATFGSGKINGGALYNTSDTVDVITATSAAINLNTGMLEMWFKDTKASSDATNSAFFFDTDNARHAIYHPLTTTMGIFNDSRETDFSVTYAAGSVHHIAMLYNKTGNIQRLFIDGAEVTSSSTSGVWGSTALGTNFYLGRRFANVGGQHNAFQGTLDEVRTHSIIRADAWVTTTYNNVNSISTFWTVGTPNSFSSITYRRTFTGNMRGR